MSKANIRAPRNKAWVQPINDLGAQTGHDSPLAARSTTIAGYAWWWRYEIGIASGLAIGMYVLTRVVGPGQAVMGIVLTAGLLGPWPPAHRAMTTSAWVIITPHRLRVGFVQARIHDRNGRLPTILHTTRQPFGERVLIWCQAGTSAADLRSARGVLAAACWATAIRVATDQGHTNLLTIDVIRRDPGRTEPDCTGPKVRCRAAR